MDGGEENSRRYVYESEVGWSDLELSKFYLGMPLGSLLIRGLLHPIQLVKTHIQASKDTQFRGATQAVVELVRAGGVRALYRGFMVNMMGILHGPVYITGLEYGRHAWLEFNRERQWIADPFVAEKVVGAFVGGAGAAMFAQSLSVPIDIIAQHQMVQAEGTPKRSAMDIARHIVQQQGIRGLFRGYGISLLIYVPSSGITWSTFYSYRSQMKRLIECTASTSPNESKSSSSSSSVDSGLFGATLPLPQWQWLSITAVAGAMAGATSAVCSNPLDVLRTRMQLETAPVVTLASTFRELVKQDGYHGLLRGLSARVLSSSSSMFIVMLVYELAKQFASKKPSE